MISARAASKRKRSHSRIQVQDRQRRYRLDTKAVAAFCSAILEGLDRSGHCVSVAFVGPSSMRMLNRRYRGKDYATDVLSFEYGGETAEGEPFLGELVLAPHVAATNAIRYGCSPEQEIRKLLVHGLLHLLGYDHETDSGEMNRLQRSVLRRRRALAPPPLLREPAA